MPLDLIKRWGLHKPDGRPLYAYRLNEADYERQARCVRQWLQGAANGNQVLNSAAFCLYAAETFRREHIDGAWAWETIFLPLEIPTPLPHTIYHWVSRGLEWWDRQILHDQNGHHLYLVTIACEGGLPLRLLKGNNRLANYFRELLDEYYRAGFGGEDDAYTCAQGLAHLLPPRHRQEAVFQLSGRLLATVVQLWQSIGDVPEPIAALDQMDPEWRERLPLNADDATVNALLAPLMTQVLGLSRAAEARLRWQGLLRETNTNEWKIEKILDLPQKIRGSVVRNWLNLRLEQPIPVRLRLRLITETDNVVVALLTRGRGEGEEAIYHREWLHQGGLRITAEALLSPHNIALDDGRHLTGLQARGQDSWAAELPWLFVEKSGSLIWHSQGCARTKAETAWVVVPDGLSPEEAGADDCRHVGQITTAKRKVYQVQATTTFNSPEGETFQVICGSPDDTDDLYRVSGETVPGLMSPRPVYRGLPGIRTEDGAGVLSIPRGRREWRPVGHHGPWLHDGQGFGLLWLRLVDPVNFERLRRQVAVVPQGLRIERILANAQAAGGLAGGSYRLTGLCGGQVTVTAPDVTGINLVNNGPGDLTVTCPALGGAHIPLLTFEMRWGDGQPIRFDLPYPQRSAVFLLGGKVLPQGASVPVSRCGGLRLLILDPAGHGHYDLYRGVRLNDAHVGFLSPLPPLQDGRLDYSLHPWQDQLYALLSSRNAINQRVHLAIQRVGQQLAKVSVRHFDATLIPGPSLVPEMPPDRICVQTRSPDQHDNAWQERLTLSMFPLWDPTRTPQPLTPCADQPLAWQLPDNLEVGPWWVIGRDRDWARFRPLLWTVRATGADEPLVVPGERPMRLDLAIREPDQAQRQCDLDTVLAALGTDPNHPDWPLLFSFIDLTREFPPNTLDVLRELLNHDCTLAMTLLKASEDSFERAWSLADGLPFLWWLLPIDDWLSVTADYLGSVQQALGDIDKEGKIINSLFDGFRNRTQTRFMAFGPLCDWLQEHLMPWRPLRQEESLVLQLRAHPELIAVEVTAALQRLQTGHITGEIWPNGNEVLNLADDRSFTFSLFRFQNRDRVFRPVLCAPFVAAHITSMGTTDNFQKDRLVMELRLIRSFDQTWFDKVYNLALAFCLAQLPPTRGA